MSADHRTLYLCAGLQSGGTTLISWCFLQRADMDGILDANNDIFADLPPTLGNPFAWLKTTIASFRACEQIAYFEDLGWTVRPLLICRDVRSVYASLRTKPYGINGTTAEDPPLRLRLRRFRADWEQFRARGWPILRYEHFLADPEETLAGACRALNLPWDDAMITWPKPKSAIFDTRHGNRTFRQSRSSNLRSSLAPNATPNAAIPAGELAWLESEFADFNRINAYPDRLAADAEARAGERDLACFSATRRAQWRQPRTQFPYLIHRVTRWLKTELASI